MPRHQRIVPRGRFVTDTFFHSHEFGASLSELRCQCHSDIAAARVLGEAAATSEIWNRPKLLFMLRPLRFWRSFWVIESIMSFNIDHVDLTILPALIGQNLYFRA